MDAAVGTAVGACTMAFLKAKSNALTLNRSLVCRNCGTDAMQGNPTV